MGREEVMSTLLSLGVPLPDLRSALTVLLAGLVCIPFRYIHGYRLRLVVDIICGLLLSILASGYWGVISLMTTIITYIALKYSNKKKDIPTDSNTEKEGNVEQKTASERETGVTFSKVSMYVVLGNFVLLFVLQIFKRRKASNALSPSLFYNWISQQMILFQKLVALALNSNESFVNWTSPNKDKNKDRRGACVPSFIELLGYCFTTNGSLAGGYVELSDYRNWLNETNRDVLTQTDIIYLPWKENRNKSSNNTKCNNCPWALLRKHRIKVRAKANIMYVVEYLSGIFWLIVYALMGPYARRFLIVGKEQYGQMLAEQASGSWGSKLFTYVRALLYLDFGCTIFRTKYYFVWKLFRAMTLGNYFAVAPADNDAQKKGPANYNVANNINVLDCELALSSRDSMANWNINATQWFRRYIYMALTSQTDKVYGQRSIATIITNASSALWHGISGGYYLFFVGFAVCVIIGRSKYNYIDPLFEELASRDTAWGGIVNTIYKISCIISARIERALYLPFFILLSVDSGIVYLKNVKYVPLIWSMGHWLLYKALSCIPFVKNTSKKRRKH